MPSVSLISRRGATKRGHAPLATLAGFDLSPRFNRPPTRRKLRREFVPGQSPTFAPYWSLLIIPLMLARQRKRKKSCWEEEEAWRVGHFVLLWVKG